MTTSGHELCVRQNDKKGIGLLAARQETFRMARHAFVAQIILMVALPLAAWTIVTILGDGRMVVASIILFLTIFDILVLDRVYRDKIISASRIAQEFDCYVFGLPYDNLFLKSPEDIEKISERGARFLEQNGDSKLLNWYSTSITDVRKIFAIIVSQRTNVTYDKRVRNTYRTIIFVSLFVALLVMAIVTLTMGQTFEFLVTALFLPAAPLLIWSFREWKRQKDAVDEAVRLQAYLEAQLNGLLIGQIAWDLAKEETNRIQNAIYLWRSTNPLSFPGIYWMMRDRLEENMKNAATYWVTRYSDVFTES
uniref:S-4TM family putative pore-forming effector n=1 Tax=uncultured Erythrobacter sp. TaxID=263913 RepID=UPI00261275ED|nr:S-4TM family putative pore-forming effector [uncultured Erythrobacter sp.]